jgi:hypothetical protein
VPDDYEFSRVPLLAVDAWRYGPRDDRQQYELQRHLMEALTASAARSGLDLRTWDMQEAGDGLLALLPDSGAEPVLVDSFVRELDTWLRRHNHDRLPEARLRLRVAVHHGPAVVADLGYASGAVVHVCRLRDSRPVRGALDAVPEANLVQAVSALVFEDVIRQRHTSLSAHDFTKIEIADKAKDFTATAWLHVPGASPDRLTAPASGTLAVGLRFLDAPHGRGEIVEQVLASFGKAGITLPEGVSLDGDDPLVCLSEASVQVVLGIWLDHLDKLLASRAPGARLVVGVCLSPDRESAGEAARGLASSNIAVRVLAAARGGRVVVVVPDHVHAMITRHPGRLVLPENYGRADASSWLRVPGHSMPPQPVDDVREEPVPVAGPGSVNNVSAPRGVAIGYGTVGTINHYDRRD